MNGPGSCIISWLLSICTVERISAKQNYEKIKAACAPWANQKDEPLRHKDTK
jgi:hypothetical protein